jgi:uncharacterized protein YndB with AHSA1/START domain
MADPAVLTSYTIEKRYAVSPERLFRAFTEEEELKGWVWGGEAEVTKALVEPVSGGRLHIVAKNEFPDWPHDEVAMRGMILVCEPGRKLIHTLHWDAPVGYNAEGLDPIDEVIAADFQPDGDGCRLRYTHQGIPDDGQSAPTHERSVKFTLDLLEKRLAAEREGSGG